MRLAIFGHQFEAVGQRIRRVANGHRLPLEGHRAGVRALRADQGAGQLRASGPKEAGDAEDLATPQDEADVADEPAPREVLDAQELVAGSAAAPRVVLADLAVRHEPHELRDGRGLRGQGGHAAPVPHHGDAVADARDFFQAMRDVE